jgi:hypothetical protein
MLVFCIEWCDVYGWGAITEDGSIEDELSKSSQQVYSSEDCVRSYPGLIHEGMMCAGDAEAGSGPCQVSIACAATLFSSTKR